MFELLIGTCLISPILWIVSVVLTLNWKHFKKLVVVNILLFITYISIIDFTNWVDLGHDEYGLGIIFLNIVLIVGHVILRFISCIIINRKIKKGDYS